MNPVVTADMSEEDIYGYNFCVSCNSNSSEPLVEPNCLEKPELLINVPLGMYHCPDCGGMILAGVQHHEICKECWQKNVDWYEKNGIKA